MGAARRRAALREDRPQETRAHLGEYRNRAKAYLVTMSTGPAQLTEEQVAELRSWADRLLENGASGDLETFARAIGPLTDEAERLRAGESGSRRISAVASLRREAHAAVDNGASDEVRAAARAVLLLCDDIAARRASARAGDTARRRRTLYAIAGGAVFVGVAAFVALGGGSGDLDATGPDSTLVGRDALSTLAFTVAGDPDDVATTAWTLDGRPVASRATAKDGRIVFRPRGLADGEHTVAVLAPGRRVLRVARELDVHRGHAAARDPDHEGLAGSSSRRRLHAAGRRGARCARTGERESSRRSTSRADSRLPSRGRRRGRSSSSHTTGRATRPTAASRWRRRLGSPATPCARCT